MRYEFDQVAQHLLGTDRLNRRVKSREVRRRQLLERMYARLQSEEPLARRPVERVKNLSLAEAVATKIQEFPWCWKERPWLVIVKHIIQDREFDMEHKIEGSTLLWW